MVKMKQVLDEAVIAAVTEFVPEEWVECWFDYWLRIEFDPMSPPPLDSPRLRY